MNKKIDELKDISISELADIEADLQEMEDRLEHLETKEVKTIDSINHSALITPKQKQMPFNKRMGTIIIQKMDLQMSQQQPMVQYYMFNLFWKRMYPLDLCSKSCVALIKTNHYPLFENVCLCVVGTAPEKGSTFLDAIHTTNNVVDRLILY
ncbi:hypothetical protein TNCT_662471 [Trichonephila clavata]|uniref:Uncharacterized protein n=1 Tax=Trichonephila clavata TaxID=2740835 RepID=A0A8X6LH11_TRICU|nr:hypothetical protein TNCT_662471 [Trichonephila clavata]